MISRARSARNGIRKQKKHTGKKSKRKTLHYIQSAAIVRSLRTWSDPLFHNCSHFFDYRNVTQFPDPLTKTYVYTNLSYSQNNRQMIARIPLFSVVLAVMAICLVLTAKQDAQVTHILTGYHPLSRLAILQQGPSRMMASKAMTTYVVYRTTIPTCSFTTSCAVTNGPVTACRRRELDIDAILPNRPIKYVKTAF